MRFDKPLAFITLVFMSQFLAGCQSRTPLPGPTPANSTPTVLATVTSPVVPQATATRTQVPTRTLVVCTQDEPTTLYPYGGSSRSMWSVLEAIYDGPFDTRAFSAQPVILQKIPSLADGDAAFVPVTVRAGDPVIDLDGNLVALKAGARVMPSGCSDASCAITWDGQSVLEMDQLNVTFKLLANMKWSDGQPLTAGDSVFSYNLAADPATPSAKYVTDRTATYTAQDDQTVQWSGLPGFFEQRYGTYFFLPLPRHLWLTKSALDLLTDEAATRTPLGWGPYMIQEWKSGDHITLTKNPNYFRAAEGLPKFDTLVYRFIGATADGNMNALLAGECDVVDQNAQLVELMPDLLQREQAGKLMTYAGQGPEWEHLDFGIRPAVYDDGYNPAGERPDLFGDVRTRQAFALCINRDNMIAEHLYRRSIVPDSYLSPSHPLFLQDLPKYAYNPDGGAQLLDQVGWKDTDNDSSTPRIAAGVSGVPDGTPLSITYLTTQAALRVKVAQAVATGLTGCGIQVNVTPTNPGDLFAPGPEGPVFGRQFDLVQFSWESGTRSNCQLYSASQIPGPANHWIGANISGYLSPEFDAACASANESRSANDDAVRSRAVQEQFARELPAIPLYFYPKIAISRFDLCGIDMDVTARSILWNIELFDYGQSCGK